jgi:hypothetical protein
MSGHPAILQKLTHTHVEYMNTEEEKPKPTIHQFSQGIMQELETNAQKALATPEIQQGIMFEQKRSATEIAEASANVDTRYALTASLFSIAEVVAHLRKLKLLPRLLVEEFRKEDFPPEEDDSDPYSEIPSQQELPKQ